VSISAAMVSSTGLAEVEARHPDRVIDCGIAEQHAVTLAAGLAMAGRKPYVAIYSSFLQRAMDQVTMDVALHGLPVTFLVDRAGVTGPDGPSHHGVFDLTFLRMIPNMVVGAPADAADLCGMIETAATHDGPMTIRYPKAAATSIPAIPVSPIPVGEWVELSAGDDVLFLANGRHVETAQKVATRLEQDGLSVGVVNARWVKPLDDRLPDWASGAKVVVTVEDNVVAGGFGAAVLEALAGTGLAAKVHTIGVPDAFLPFGSADDVLEAVGMDVDGLTERVQVILRR